MSQARPVRLVVGREVAERLRAKSFVISTAIYLLLAMAAVVVPHLVGDADTRPLYGVGVAGDGAATFERAAGELAPTFGVDLRFERLADARAAEEAVRDGSVDVAVVDGRRALARGGPPARLAAVLEAATYQARLADGLAAAGVSAQQAAALLRPTELRFERLAGDRPLRTSNRPLAFAGILVIYLLLLTYGFTVANGVLEEKSSRVSEVLLGTLRPAQLLGGKVVGIGVVALVQLVVVGVPAGVTAVVLGGSLSVPAGSALTVASIVMWAVLGYAFYSCLFAAAGAAAAHPEDVGNATAPITVLILLTYFLAFASIESPDSTLARVVSFIPPMAPMTMMPRAAIGNVAAWEVPLSVALLLVMTYGTVRLGGRVYAGGMRRPGPRLKLREAWRAAGS